MDVTTISGVIAGMNSAIAMLKTVVSERDSQLVLKLESELFQKLNTVQLEYTKLLDHKHQADEKNRQLTFRIHELEAAQSERERYGLDRIGSLDSFAYKLRPPEQLSERKNEPSHFICQPCFDSGKKGVLAVGRYTAHCPLCKTALQTNAMPSAAPIRRNPPNYQLG